MTRDNESSLFLRVSLMDGVAVSHLVWMMGLGLQRTWAFSCPAAWSGAFLLSLMEPRLGGGVSRHLPVSPFSPLTAEQQAWAARRGWSFSSQAVVGCDATFLREGYG